MTDTNATKSFESALSELDGIAKRLSEGGGTLDQVLKDYETAVGLIRYCQSQLNDAQQKLKILTEEEIHDGT